MMPFLIVGLPRSRTAWMAKALTYGGHVCRHEPSLHWTSPKDFRAWLRGSEGASDSMMTWLAHETKRRCPDIPLIVIRRPIDEVMGSLRRFGLEPARRREWLSILDDRLDRIEDDLDCVSVAYDRIDAQFPYIFRRCLGVTLPPDWRDKMVGENVQADLAETFRVAKENQAGWMSVYKGYIGSEP